MDEWSIQRFQVWEPLQQQKQRNGGAKVEEPCNNILFKICNISDICSLINWILEESGRTNTAVSFQKSATWVSICAWSHWIDWLRNKVTLSAIWSIGFQVWGQLQQQQERKLGPNWVPAVYISSPKSATSAAFVLYHRNILLCRDLARGGVSSFMELCNHRVCAWSRGSAIASHDGITYPPNWCKVFPSGHIHCISTQQFFWN